MRYTHSYYDNQANYRARFEETKLIMKLNTLINAKVMFEVNFETLQINDIALELEEIDNKLVMYLKQKYTYILSSPEVWKQILNI